LKGKDGRLVMHEVRECWGWHPTLNTIGGWSKSTPIDCFVVVVF